MSDKVTPLEYLLPEGIGIPDRLFYQNLKKRIEPLANGDITLSGAGKKRREQIRAYALSGKALGKLMLCRKDVRLFVGLVRDDDQVANKIQIDGALLRAIDAAVHVFSPSLLRQLCTLYFERYDSLGGWKLLRSYLRKHFVALKGLEARSRDLRTYQQHGESLFSNGPDALVGFARGRNLKLPQAADEWGVPHGPRVRFFQLATFIYYLETLENLEIGAGSRVMAEIAKDEVKGLVVRDRELLGHAAVSALIKRVLEARVQLPDVWRDFILQVCGDPRVPKNSRMFARWWGMLDPKYVDAMRRWLSKLDLKLFLNVLEQIADSGLDPDMKRMFPSRRKFLEGLYDQDLIQHSRLILSRDAERRLLQTMDRADLPEYARVSDGTICMIYLDLGSAHLIEGTHNFAVRVYRHMKIRGLADYGRKEFSSYEVRRKGTITTITHSKSDRPLWQNKLISCLKQKSIALEVKPEAVLTPKDYKLYRREFGMS